MKQLIAIFFCLQACIIRGQHPSILMTTGQLPEMRNAAKKYPLFERSFMTVKAKADRALSEGINVPVPADGGGGATHEQHKKNYQDMLNAAMVYQVSGEKKYSLYVASLLSAYADKYEQWPLHPARKQHQVPGRIFWQNLNDCVWAVYAIQAYDLIYNELSSAQRMHIENHLFRPILQFMTVDSKKTFDKVHNHGTWCAAAVGMIGYVLNEQDYVDAALYGSNKNRKTGYLAMLDQLFSPDGYYTEGPYYQRYSMLPFMLFAKAIHNHQPELRIYKYRDSILAKAVNTTLQLTYTNGAFFPLNDAIKDKTLESEEIVYCLDLAYSDIAAQPGLLDIAARQGRVILSDAGLKVAKDIAGGKAGTFIYRSGLIHDGRNGDEGALAVLRSGSNADQQCIVVKGAGHGMGHGHFDQLNMLYYDHGVEVFSDYGAARFLNIVTKHGGDYLPENTTWAKTTVAHNTLVVDRKSQFMQNAEKAQKYHSDIISFDNNDTCTVAAFRENNAYKGVDVRRTVILYKPGPGKKGLLIDINDVRSSDQHHYELPYWYQGHIVAASFRINMNSNLLQPFDTASGYQHLWLKQKTGVLKGGAHISVLNNNRFYTTSFVTNGKLDVHLVALGAHDPENNLRNEQAFILSRPDAGNSIFFTVTESHGVVNPVEETVTGTTTAVSDMQITGTTKDRTRLSFRYEKKEISIQLDYTGTPFIKIKKEN